MQTPARWDCSRASRSPTRASSGSVQAGEAKPALKKVAVAHEDGGRRVLVVGLGKRDEFDPERARVAAAAAATRAKELGSTSLSWAAPPGDGVSAALVEGTLLKLYSYRPLQVLAGERRRRRHRVARAGGRGRDSAEVERARVGAEAANAARDLQNLPSNIATPAFLAERAAEIAEEHESLELELLDARGGSCPAGWARSLRWPRAPTQSRA